MITSKEAPFVVLIAAMSGVIGTVIGHDLIPPSKPHVYSIHDAVTGGTIVASTIVTIERPAIICKTPAVYKCDVTFAKPGDPL